MPSGTKYNPLRTGDLDKTQLNFDAQGVSATAVAGTTTNVDYTLADDCLVTGAWIVTNGGAYGDTASMQVVDTSGAFSGTPGTLLNQFVTSWFFPPAVDLNFDMVYPAKILAGMTLRIAYTSAGTSDVSVAVNWYLHKVLD